MVISGEQEAAQAASSEPERQPCGESDSLCRCRATESDGLAPGSLGAEADAARVRATLNMMGADYYSRATVLKSRAEALAALDRLLAGKGGGVVDTAPLQTFFRAYRAELESRCRAHMDEADRSDDEGAHIGLARHHRALAAGLNEAILALDEMWRAG